jgi:hypothetical protein
MYDGGQLSLLGDVVVVTVNHRLASFGYTHLAALGAPEEFMFAGVCGVMDMVASLEWVRDNIAAFGGDPSRVMIFGQSGGGSKTSTLLGTPAAKGLFHRAAVQSGSTLRLADEAAAAKSAEMLLQKLGITKNRIADIQRVSWEQILQAQTEATGVGFTPVMDGKYLPHHPFDPSAPAESRDVPIIISTTLEDAALRLTNWDLTDAGLTSLLNERYKGKATEILALYRDAAASETPDLVHAQVSTDTADPSPRRPAGRAQGRGRRRSGLYVHLGVADVRVRRQARRRPRSRRRGIVQSVPKRDWRCGAERRTDDVHAPRVDVDCLREDRRARQRAHSPLACIRRDDARHDDLRFEHARRQRSAVGDQKVLEPERDPDRRDRGRLKELRGPWRTER